MIKFLSSLILACCLSFPAIAIEQADFYSASVFVPDRKPESFKQGLRDALVQVLAKASAEPTEKIKRSPRLALDLSRGDQLASQFSYIIKKSQSETGDELEILYLKASFPEKTVTDLLQTANLRFWPNNRPQILLWPVVKSGGGARVASISNEKDAELIKMMGEKALHYGLPWVLGETSSQNNPDRLWQWNESAILAVSRKYKKSVILVSRLGITSDKRGMGGWLLIENGKKFKIDVNTKTLDAFVDRGMAMAARKLASRYAVRLSDMDNELILMVGRIDSDEKYQALIAYLEKLNVVDRVYLLNATGQMLRLAVTLKSDMEQFQKVLAQNNKLMPDLEAEESAYQLSLYWNEGK